MGFLSSSRISLYLYCCHSYISGPPISLSLSFSLPLMGIINNCYCYMDDLLRISSYRPPYQPQNGSNPTTPIRLDILTPYLVSHPDQVFAQYIFKGLRDGFRIGFNHTGTSLKSSSHNHPSTRDHPDIVTSHILDEIQSGRLRPLRSSQAQISPIGLIPKPHVQNKWRLIVDLSFPRGRSVNDGISPALCSLSYASVDDAVHMIMQLGPGTELVKVDISNAYRMVPVHPDDQALLGIAWQGVSYVDRALPFGLRSAPKIFTTLSDFLAWVLYWDGIGCLLHYLDDFLFFGRPGSGQALVARHQAERSFATLGVPIATHKTEGPSTLLTFLGIQIDTVIGQLSLPPEKLIRIRSMVEAWGTRRSCTRKELECFLGHLSHAATVIRPGRIFLRHLFSLLTTTSNPHHFVRLNSIAKADIYWWQCLLHHWNGYSFFPLPQPTDDVYSDASGSFGCGAFSIAAGGFQLQWPQSWAGIEITAKELVPIVIAAAIWGQQWSRRHICFHMDNEAVVAIISKNSSKSLPTS